MTHYVKSGFDVRTFASFRFSALSHAIFFTVVASVLFLAASTKFWLATQDPFVEITTGFLRRGIILVAIVETLVSMYLIFGRDRLQKYVVIFLLFSVFLTESTTAIVMDKIQCNCFGGFLQSPRLMAGIDAVVTALAIFGIRANLPSGLNGQSNWESLAPILYFCLGVGVPVFSVLGASQYDNDASSVFQARVASLPFKAYLDETKEVSVSIQNNFVRPIKLIGAQTSCGCIVVDEVDDFIIQPGATRNLKIRVIPKESGPFLQRVYLFFDCPPPNLKAVEIAGVFKERG